MSHRKLLVIIFILFFLNVIELVDIGLPGGQRNLSLLFRSNDAISSLISNNFNEIIWDEKYFKKDNLCWIKTEESDCKKYMSSTLWFMLKDYSELTNPKTNKQMGFWKDVEYDWDLIKEKASYIINIWWVYE